MQKIHNNLGHPELRVLLRSLRIAGASEEAIEAAKLLKCPVCAQMAPPATRRPSQVSRATVFGELVAVDLFWVKDCKDQVFTILNVVDAATRFQVCTPCRSKRPDDVLSALEACWLSWAGLPEKRQCDQGGVQQGLW